jgi:hypothetical protein
MMVSSVLKVYVAESIVLIARHYILGSLEVKSWRYKAIMA